MFTSPAAPMGRTSADFFLKLALGLAVASSAVASAPRIVSVSPERVPPDGSVRVSVLGEGFEPGMTVSVCGSSIEDAAYVSENQVDFLAPAHELGWCEIRVVNPDGRASAMKVAYTRVPEGEASPSPAPARSRPELTDYARALAAPLWTRVSPPSAAPSAAVTNGADTVAVGFLTRLMKKQDLSPLAHALLKQPIPAGVVFDWQFSDAWPGAVNGISIVDYEGRLESVDRAGHRAWLPFALLVTHDAPSRVAAFQVMSDPAATRDQMLSQMETAVGGTVLVDWSKPIRPLPLKQ